MKMLQQRWTRVLARGLESAGDAKVIELHPDGDYKKISILGENNQLFEHCKIEINVFQGADEEDLTLPRISRKSGRRWAKLNSSPPDKSPEDFASDEESVTDSGTCHYSSLAELFYNLDSKSEKIQNAFSDLFAQVEICKNRLVKMEKEYIKLQGEYEELKLQNNKLKNDKESTDSLCALRAFQIPTELWAADVLINLISTLH
ncbi:hypothetical protein HOLleu_04173 [Holothuria leucospilota]|uniref:Uncharacterized protein n=1 Tax=Holothuria leucospilota TaxID=206669 RepID=A0A9Q1CTI8_HOLLE|nr:hypothetical protein HOLleu_04173 [Holothuria leucospilota]